jgi:hypothetical protein
MSPLWWYRGSPSSACPNLVSATRQRPRNKQFKDQRSNPQAARKAIKVVVGAAIDKSPAGRPSSTGAGGSFDALHANAMAYTHPAAFQIRRIANPRKNACRGGTPASACCVANTGANFVRWDQFDHRVVVRGRRRFEKCSIAMLIAGVLHANDQFTGIHVLNLTTRPTSCAETLPWDY